MIHVSLHWSEYGADILALWLFAVKHATWLYNWIPSQTHGLIPIEQLTKLMLIIAIFSGFMIVDVLPSFWTLSFKMVKNSKMESTCSNGSVMNVRNLRASYISPPFHVVFDDFFNHF